MFGPVFDESRASVVDGVATVNITLSNVRATLRLLDTPTQGVTPYCQVANGAVVVVTHASCAWFQIHGDNFSLNATVSLSPDARGLVLTAPEAMGPVTGTSFGLGTWPVNQVYSAEGLPLEPWWCDIEGACAFGSF